MEECKHLPFLPLQATERIFFKKWFRRTLFSPWTRPMKKRYYDFGAIWLNFLEDLLSYYKRSFRYICSTCLSVAYAKIVAFINSLTYFKHQFPFIGYLFANMEKNLNVRKRKKEFPASCRLAFWSVEILFYAPNWLSLSQLQFKMVILYIMVAHASVHCGRWWS